MTTSDLTPFCQAYLECALWSSQDYTEDGDSNGSLDEDYSLSDIAPETLKEAAQDCSDFTAECGFILAKHDASELFDEEQFGHDFWLSRNGHGASFFDRGNEPVWRALQDAARVWGSVDLYIGDDGLIHS